MADSDLSISQLPPLTLPVQGSDLLHIARGGEDYRISRTELVRTLLSQIADAAISGATSGHSLVYNSTTSKWENGFISWATISGRPSQFTPVAHTHLWAEIADAPTEMPAAPHTHPWTDLTGVPTEFPPEAHGHAWGDLTGIPATFPPQIHGHGWGEITGKPTTFPPDPHDHSSLYYNKAELNTSGAGGQVHWDNIANKPETFGTGDMSKSVYDQNDDGIVDAAASVPWSGVTGKPVTFSPSAHDHDDRYFTETELTTSGGGGSVHWDNITGKPTTFGGDMAKAVYDLNNDGIVDLAAAVPWSGITGKPATFPPSGHNHDDLYSLIGHNHNDLYALLSHNHDGSYSALGHIHSHATLSDIGTNTHAQIDTHLAAAAPHSGHLTDAPSDGSTYGRKNGAWTSVQTSGTSLVVNAVPSGSINGSNTVFTTAASFITGSLRVYLNGQRLKSASDFTEGVGSFTMSSAPVTGDVLLVDYDTSIGALTAGSTSFVNSDSPTGSVDGSNKIFTFSYAYVPGSMQLFRDGQLLRGGGHDYTESPSTGVVTLVSAPVTGTVLLGSYQTAISVAGNADTLDGYHATSFASKSEMSSGWMEVTDVWTRTGNHTFTVSADLTTVYRKGTKVRYKDGGAFEYGVILSSTYSAGYTTVSLIPNTDYVMAAATITDTALSYVQNPVGFPQLFNYSSSPQNITVGNGTLNAKWHAASSRLMKVVFSFCLGSTSAMGSTPTFSLPTNASGYSGAFEPLGIAMYYDNGLTSYPGQIAIYGGDGVSTVYFNAFNAGGAYAYQATVTAAIPFAWGVGDYLQGECSYLW